MFAADPGASSKSLSLRSKKCVQADEVAERLPHDATLKVQGQIFELVDGIAPAIWSKAVQSLPSGLMKFALNAAQDTLSHNVNLAHWHNLSDTCKLCRGRQTLLHLLNNCPVAVQCRRYNQWHDLVLTEITTFLTKVLDSDYTIVSDLAGADTYTFPPILVITDLRPDIVVFSEAKQHATIIELTVSFESNFKKAHNRKQAKYHDVLDDIKENGFDTDLITIEVGSRGFICPDGFDQLKDTLLISGRQMEKLLVKVSVAAIRLIQNLDQS